MVLTGNIGAGKSTLLEALGSIERVVMVEESWANSEVLQDFMESPKENAFRFQMVVLDHYEGILKEALRQEEACARDGLSRAIVMERSPVDCRDVFIPENAGNMSREEMDVCMARCHALLSEAHWADALCVRLGVDMEECMARIKQRGRGKEVEISIEYLSALERRYASMRAHVMLPNMDLGAMQKNKVLLSGMIRALIA